MSENVKEQLELLQRKKQNFARLIAAQKAKDSLIAFSRFMEPDPNAPDDVEQSLYVDRPHHHVIAEALEKAENGILLAKGTRFLCLSTGPQKGKSQLTSRNFISWMIGRNPKRNIMLGSYNDDFAREFGDDVRNIMQKPQYAQVFPLVRLRKGGKAKDHMVTEAGGKLSFIGRGGSGTGRPADCLPGNSIILTEHGLMRLDAFISAGMPCRVASFDHCTYNQVWRPVIAWSARDAKEIYEIETESGRVIRATGNHKIFINGRGYIRASELSIGDPVLCGVWETGNFAQVSVGQESKKRLPEYLLQQRLSGGLIQQEVPMRQAKRLERPSVLLKGMREKIRSLRSAFTHALKHYVPTMREHFQAKIASNTILFERLCELGTFGTNERTREFALQGWPLLCHVVRQDEVGNLRAGREQVQGLPDSRGTKSYFLAQQKSDAQRHDRPSYRRERDKQSPREPDLSLRNMPRNTSQVVCDAISMVRRIRCEGERVYDIQVEGTGNFFANEVLVHNCFIIDDPIKNFEEAESLTIRNMVWNWFLKVADSRTHGNSVIVAIQTRWHEDDLIGRLTDKTNPHYPEKMAAKTMYINIPSIVENTELARLLKVPVGGSIWEEKFPLWLLEMKRDADPRGFGAMEMGRPTPPEGSFYKVGHVRQCYYKDISQLPRNLTRYGSCDLAVSDDLKSDDSVILDWGLDENDTLWLLPDCYWHKKKADASVDSLINMGKDKWMTLFAEKGVIDRAIGPFLEKRMMEMGAYFNVKTFTNVNKGHASHSFRARMAQGKVRFPVFAEWWQRAEEQMLKFTGSGDDREDDFCDALARIGQGIMLQVGASKFTPQKNAKVIPIGSVGWARRLYDIDRAKQKRTTRKYG